MKKIVCYQRMYRLHLYNNFWLDIDNPADYIDLCDYFMAHRPLIVS